MVKQQKRDPKIKEDLAKKKTTDGRGGARQGAGRRYGSGAFGEATVPMRVPRSWAVEINAALEAFKARVVEKNTEANATALLDLKALRKRSWDISGGTPSGKPVDLGKMIARHPESCFAWTSDSENAELGMLAGDVVVVDRSAKPAEGSIVALWKDSGIEMRRHQAPSGAKKNEEQEPKAWGVAVALIRTMPRGSV